MTTTTASRVTIPAVRATLDAAGLTRPGTLVVRFGGSLIVDANITRDGHEQRYHAMAATLTAAGYSLDRVDETTSAIVTAA